MHIVLRISKWISLAVVRLPQSNNAAQYVAGVDADSHVNIETRRLSHEPDKRYTSNRNYAVTFYSWDCRRRRCGARGHHFQFNCLNSRNNIIDNYMFPIKTNKSFVYTFIEWISICVKQCYGCFHVTCVVRATIIINQSIGGCVEKLIRICGACWAFRCFSNWFISTFRFAVMMYLRASRVLHSKALKLSECEHETMLFHLWCQRRLTILLPKNKCT